MWRWLVLGVGLFAVLLCGGYWFANRKKVGIWQELAYQLPAEKAAARKAGVPLTVEDILPNPPIPVADNAAGPYRAAIEQIEALGDTNEMQHKLELAALDSNSSNVAAARYVVRRLRPLVSTAEKGAMRPKCWFDRDWTQGALMVLPEYAQMKKVAKLLAGQARFEDSQGHLSEALRLLGVADRMASHTAQEPMLISFLVGIATEAVNNRTYEIMISKHANDLRGLALIEAQLNRKKPIYGFVAALDGEVLCGLYTLNTIRNLKDLEMLASGSSATSPPSVPPLDSTMRKAFETRLLQVWREVYEKMDRKGDPRETAKMLDKAASRMEETSDPTYLYNAIVLPVFTQAADAEVRMLAGRRLLQAKIEILRYRKTHGRFPASLDPLGRKVIDPMTGDSMVYRKQGNGFVLYSVGADGKDDGGQQAVGAGRDVVVEHPVAPKKTEPAPVF